MEIFRSCLLSAALIVLACTPAEAKVPKILNPLWVAKQSARVVFWPLCAYNNLYCENLQLQAELCVTKLKLGIAEVYLKRQVDKPVEGI